MNLINLPLVVEYPGYFPDFGMLKYLIYQYTDYDVPRAHAVWDGLCIVIIPFLMVLVWRGLKKGIVIYKRWKVTKLIHHFSEKDPIWNKNTMVEMAENLFYQVQSAWFSNSFRSLAPVLTDKIKLEWQETWKLMRLNHYKFMVGQIDVRSVNIISVEDHFDNNRDKFQVEISGYIKRYVKNKPDGTLFVRSSSDYEEFTDIYSFVRFDDDWLLDGIHHSAKIDDILNTKNKDYHIG